jgi:hypothetical protein
MQQQEQKALQVLRVEQTLMELLHIQQDLVI